MNLEEFKKNGYTYLDIKVEEDIIDRLVNIISEREKEKEGLSQLTKHYMKMSQPWLIDECMELALRDDFLAVPAAYFENRDFYLGSGNLRRTKYTSQPATQVALFHRDMNIENDIEKTNGNFMKIFVYLSDVTEENGPFTYVETSNNIFLDDLTTYRKTDRSVNKKYPNLVKKLVGKKGQVLAAQTHGIHKGLKPLRGHRDMLTINYATTKESPLVHSAQEYNIRKALYDKLPDNKKEICKNLLVLE
jgi:hypothetical protein